MKKKKLHDVRYVLKKINKNDTKANSFKIIFIEKCDYYIKKENVYWIELHNL